MRFSASWTIALAAVTLSVTSISAQDTFFTPLDSQYQSFCGPQAPAPPLGAICFQTNYDDVGSYVTDASPRLMALVANDRKGE